MATRVTLRLSVADSGMCIYPKPGGMLFIGNSETLSGITDVVKPLLPTVFRLH